MSIRNVAIIAHVDHGKTTLVDGLLKQSHTFRENEALMSQDLIMDSNDQERERGITILAKNTAVTYKGVKINIVDTPGHADFSGEVERTLNMADGVLLLVDAQEGPMPQTRFVLKKALEADLKVIVVINKIDKPNARIENTIHRLSDLFLDLATKESQLEFPIIYAIGREGKAWLTLPEDFAAPGDLTDIFEAILQYIPEPNIDNDADFQMLVAALDWDNHKGKYIIGKINRGTIHPKDKLTLLKPDAKPEEVLVDKIYVNQGLKRVEAPAGISGDIVAITGVDNADIGDTVAAGNTPVALPTIKIAEPTMSISVGPNTSPFKGTEGSQFNGSQIQKRIMKELQTNVAMKCTISEDNKFILSGRGELHLSVFLETLRREGFEIEVGKPKVITKVIDGVKMEPVEEYTIDVATEYLGAVNGELGKRSGILVNQEDTTPGYSRLAFEVKTRNALGLNSALLTLTKGTSTVSSTFLRYAPATTEIRNPRKGAIVASEAGKAAPVGLRAAQEKGPIFIGLQTAVYMGMIVGLNGRDNEIEINVCKGKNLANKTRSKGEEAVIINPHVVMSLEQCLDFLEDDELLEITPLNLRLRKKILDQTLRYRAIRNNAQ